MFGHNQCCTLCNTDHRYRSSGRDLLFLVRDRLKFLKLVLDLYHNFTGLCTLSRDRDIHFAGLAERELYIQCTIRLYLLRQMRANMSTASADPIPAEEENHRAL